MSSSTSVHQLFGLPPTSPALSDFLSSLDNGKLLPDPDVKSYPDAVYFNYYSLGISFLYAPGKGYKPKTGVKYGELSLDNLALDSLDVYNTPESKDATKSASSRSEAAFVAFPVPLVLNLAPNVKDKDGNVLTRPSTITLSEDMTGKDFVQAMGEPDRKGGGAGPSSGSIGIWCEWSGDGIMVEFGGDASRGPNAWERGKDAPWRVATIFAPKQA
ncbi:hypothetical protein FA15DRAFT_651282 [Coprinopsis marcescibilis]|uniref:Uncharacterized protein n=1 Tax=Coprinopsis marcescibilis TaxID=230819 RepID=A0A5C3LDQ1_COPMA|nr:hypothetical protein FA15DRAFT_651282 [Coprinopsis marcescibilis]